MPPVIGKTYIALGYIFRVDGFYEGDVMVTRWKLDCLPGWGIWLRVPLETWNEEMKAGGCQ